MRGHGGVEVRACRGKAGGHRTVRVGYGFGPASPAPLGKYQNCKVGDGPVGCRWVRVVLAHGHGIGWVRACVCACVRACTCLLTPKSFKRDKIDGGCRSDET